MILPVRGGRCRGQRPDLEIGQAGAKSMSRYAQTLTLTQILMEVDSQKQTIPHVCGILEYLFSPSQTHLIFADACRCILL